MANGHPPKHPASKAVFINCPFDDGFKPILRAMVFTMAMIRIRRSVACATGFQSIVPAMPHHCGALPPCRLTIDCSEPESAPFSLTGDLISWTNSRTTISCLSWAIGSHLNPKVRRRLHVGDA